MGARVGGADQYKQAAHSAGLDLELVIPRPGGNDAYAALTALHQRGRLARYCVLDAHGCRANGQHTVEFPHGPINTLDFVRHIRDGNRYRETLIHIHTCYGASVRDALCDEEGPHLICGGKKEVLSRVGRSTVLDMLEFLGSHKRQADATPLSAQAIFDRASCHMGDTVTLVGRAVGCHVRYAKTPAHLADAGREKVLDALATRINVGSLAQVGALLDAYPWLLSDPVLALPSPVASAWTMGRTEVMEELVRRGASWDRDLGLMVAVAVRLPVLLPQLCVALCHIASRILGNQPADGGQAGTVPASRELSCGVQLIMQLISRESGIEPLPALLALCGDTTSRDNRQAVLQAPFMHLSDHLRKEAKYAAGKEPEFHEQLARRCCLGALVAVRDDSLRNGLQRCFKAGRVQGMLPLIKRVSQSVDAGTKVKTCAWINSVRALAAQQLLAVLQLPERGEILGGMLYCLGLRSRRSMLAMQSVWNARCASWCQELVRSQARADVNEFLMDIQEDVINLLVTMLPATDVVAYRATLTPDGGAPSEKTLQLLGGLLCDCEAVDQPLALLPAVLSAGPLSTDTLPTEVQD
jgi:hypothetical protein